MTNDEREDREMQPEKTNCLRRFEQACLRLLISLACGILAVWDIIIFISYVRDDDLVGLDRLVLGETSGYAWIALGFSVATTTCAYATLKGLKEPILSSTSMIVVLAVLQIIMAVRGLSASHFKQRISEELADSAKHYQWHSYPLSQHNESLNMVTHIWDRIQSNFECCGLSSQADWDLWRPKNVSTEVMPISCCDRLTQRRTYFKYLHGTYKYKDLKYECLNYNAYSAACSLKMGDIALNLLLWFMVFPLAHFTLAILSFANVLGMLSDERSRPRETHIRPNGRERYSVVGPGKRSLLPSLGEPLLPS